MSFLNFFIQYFFQGQFTDLHNNKYIGRIVPICMDIFIIYLDNPKNNIYFPFQKTEVIDFNTLKSVINNLDIILISPVRCIFLNYNKVECSIDSSDFIIKSIDNYMKSSDKYISQEIDDTILEKPLLFRLGDDKYFFDFKINQKFIDSPILVELFKMYKLVEPYTFEKHWSFLRPFFGLLPKDSDSNEELFLIDPSYEAEKNTNILGIFIVGINPNNNILESNNNSWILGKDNWVNSYIGSFYDKEGDLYCKKYLGCTSDKDHSYSCKILSNCVYSNKKLLFSCSLPFYSDIVDYAGLFEFLNPSRNWIDIINLNNEKITEDWLNSKLSLIINKFSVNIEGIPVIIWLNDYSEIANLNQDLIKKYNIFFVNWSFYKFLFFSNKNSFIVGNYKDNILKDDSNLQEFYFNKVD